MVQQQERQILQNVQKLLTWMQSTIQYTKWLAMKLDMEKHSLVCLRDTSANLKVI